MKVAVLGGGNGGFAFSAHLASMEHEVNLYEIPEFAWTIEAVKKNGGIEVVTKTEIPVLSKISQGFQRLHRVTTDISEAIQGTDIIFLVVPALAQKSFFEKFIPYLKKGHIVFLNPGNLFASIELAQMLSNERIEKEIIIGEAPTLIYAAEKIGPNKVMIKGFKENFGVATFPAEDNEKFMTVIKKVFPDNLERATNVLETGLSNPNTMHHAPIMLLNTGRIESVESRKFRFYSDGTTPSIARVIDALNRERLALGKAFDLDLPHMTKLLIKWYSSHGFREDWSTYEVLTKNPIYSRLSPETMEHRFLTEDIPFGLVPMVSLADLAGTPRAVMGMLIGLTNQIHGVNYYAKGRTLSKLGLGDLSPDELIKYVSFGHL
jgi:opine dehydrogenase